MSLERSLKQTSKKLEDFKKNDLLSAERMCTNELKKIRESLTKSLENLCKKIMEEIISPAIKDGTHNASIGSLFEKLKEESIEEINNLTELKQPHSSLVDSNFLKHFITTVQNKFNQFKKMLHTEPTINSYQALSDLYFIHANDVARNVNAWIENHIYIKNSLLDSLTIITQAYDKDTDSKRKTHIPNINKLVDNAIMISKNISNKQNALTAFAFFEYTEANNFAASCKDIAKTSYTDIINSLITEYSQLANDYKKSVKQQTRSIFNQGIKSYKDHLNDKDNQKKDHYARMLGLTINNIPNINSFYPKEPPGAKEVIADTRFLQIPKDKPIYAAFESKEPMPTLNNQMHND